ncbi:MAG: ATP-binding protein, partial [Proteobacteria bacterium]|nr:ATP-binding protein [Pseudomonadota bacterium]
RWGVRPPRGVLLHGPPGTGKTLLARCLATGAGARFVHVRSTDVTSKWYGEAERRLQAVFDDARTHVPTVLFFDELDAVAPVRDDSHEATHRIVSTLLVNLDGLEDVHGVIVVGATNRVDAIDPALTRPGRFDRLVAVPLPDREGRAQVLRIHLEDASRAAGRPVFGLPDQTAWDLLLDRTEGMSGASLSEVVRRALEVRVLAGDRDGQIGVADLLVECDGVG